VVISISVLFPYYKAKENTNYFSAREKKRRTIRIQSGREGERASGREGERARGRENERERMKRRVRLRV
jgi:hypothetical protein